MKRTNKKGFILAFATALSFLLFAAADASGRGMHDVMTESDDANYSTYSADSNSASETMKSSDPSAGQLKKFGKQGKGRKFIAQKRRKSTKHRKSKDRTTSSTPTFEPKQA